MDTILQFINLEIKNVNALHDDCYAIVTINRPEAANALNAQVIAELSSALSQASTKKNLRFLLLKGNGKHFSAGADLEWMRASVQLEEAENVADAMKLLHLMEALNNFPVPTICLVRGAVYGGAVGIVACCDIAIADDSARFCLSEVKLGLLPAVILPYLARKLRRGQLRRLALTARVFSAQEAFNYGLVELVTSSQSINQALNQELNSLLSCSPEAQAKLKKLLQELSDDSLKQSENTAKTIAIARTSESAQLGIHAFINKQSMPWQKSIDELGFLNDE
ncbi:MAG: enoyl-CoA hydratase/isomerase family protein [Oligoflexales bacterium]|nr:enoyl-CoA hydratase/isomerase family protein [Oligoflexales bacterium]